MSDRDQPDDEFVEESAAKATSGTIESDSERDSDLPSFDAYGDEENWSALEDDESLGSEPEWAEEPSISEEVFDGSEREPEQGVSLSDNADESDSLFDDDDLDDDNVTLGSSRSSRASQDRTPATAVLSMNSMLKKMRMQRRPQRRETKRRSMTMTMTIIIDLSPPQLPD